VYWVGRHVGTGAVGHLGIRVRTPWWALLVGYTPALAPLWRHLTPVLERELGRVAEGRFRRYWDRSNIPQRKRRMKCGIMGNWRCISDSARCPCLRSHWVNCLVPSCWMKVCDISWVLRSIRASQIVVSVITNAWFPPESNNVVLVVIYRRVHHMGNPLRSAIVGMWDICARFRSVYPGYWAGQWHPQFIHPTLLKLWYYNYNICCINN
jgi:hypothetical protein